MASGHVNRTKRPNTVHSDASIACEQSPGRQRRRREPGKPTLRCLDRLSLSSASLAPLNRGSLNSAHIHGTDVPVEEPPTASISEVPDAALRRRQKQRNYSCFQSDRCGTDVWMRVPWEVRQRRYSI